MGYKRLIRFWLSPNQHFGEETHENVENKIEYQLSLETAETIAIEQAVLITSTRPAKMLVGKWAFPVLVGLLAATFFAFGNYVPESKSGSFSWANTITATVVGFALGVFFGWFGQLFYRYAEQKQRLNYVKEQSRVFYDKLGATRAVSWDSESVVVSAGKSRTEIKWQIVDKFVKTKNNIHAFVGVQIVFSIPQTSLPKNFTADELIKLWESYLLKSSNIS